jgi:MFS family permease
VIAHGFEAQQRVRVFAIWGTVMGVAPLLGPILGGLGTAYLGWRLAFLINLPLGAGLIRDSSVDRQDQRTVTLKRRAPGVIGRDLQHLISRN